MDLDVRPGFRRGAVARGGSRRLPMGTHMVVRRLPGRKGTRHPHGPAGFVEPPEVHVENDSVLGRDRSAARFCRRSAAAPTRLIRLQAMPPKVTAENTSHRLGAFGP